MLDRNALLTFVARNLQTNLMFRAAGADLRPIAFREIDGEDYEPQPVHFHMLLDRSGSMVNNFDEFKLKVQETITKVCDETFEWTITITAFNAVPNPEEITISHDDSNAKHL